MAPANSILNIILNAKDRQKALGGLSGARFLVRLIAFNSHSKPMPMEYCE
jgi:hypothetical protein